MYDHYTTRYSKDRLSSVRKELKRLYSRIPETTGCMENLASCHAVCCEVQSPQVMYSEFLNSWNYIMNSWKIEQIVDLVIRSVRLYWQENKGNKGCVFFDTQNRVCTQHVTRPYSCRLYSQTPDEEFVPRYERLKVLYPQNEYMPQCRLTKTIGEVPTTEDTTAWFYSLQLIERMLVDKKTPITDVEGGSYRTYNDHIMLKVGNMAFFDALTKLKDRGQEEQDRFIRKLEDRLKEGMETLRGKSA